MYAARGQKQKSSVKRVSSENPPTPCRASKRGQSDRRNETAKDLVERLRAEGSLRERRNEDDECMNLILCLGADPKNYRREKRRAFHKIVSEIYSPPRVTELLRTVTNGELTPGFAFDLTCVDPDDGQPWDFSLRAKREKARRMIREQRPLFLIGSPMCTAWCTWQALNATKRPRHLVQKELEEARMHLEFVTSLYRDQIEGGRFFLHEQPEYAASWKEKCIDELLQVPEVQRVRADQCQYDQEVLFGKYTGQPICKPTGFMSNAPELLKRLMKRCTGERGQCSRPRGGQHALCSGRAAKDAAKYTKELCRNIIKGMIAEMRSRGIMRSGEIGMHAVDDEGGLESHVNGPEEGYSGKFRDDMTGQVLKDKLVEEARMKELKYFHDKGVWMKRPKGEARNRTGRGPISVRWVDVNKGDEQNPKYRSRLVARQIKAHDKSGATFFAPTPPLEALRTVLSLAATAVGDWEPCYNPASGQRTQISLIDISRAYFNAKIDEDVETYVQLPEEDEDSASMCAKLLRHMYGTRPAADGWQEEYSTFLVEELQFKQGLSSPCVFHHREKGIIVNVHGDDFTAVGPKDSLDWYEAKMEEKYELTKQPRLGPGREDAKEAIILNRVIRWSEHGIEYEADPRQAEKLVAECGMVNVNPVGTPGVRLSFKQCEDDKELPARLHTAFRGAAARANYLAADRLDCQFAAKEVCRWMSRPTEGSWNALKRLCRYLVGLPRLVWLYKWQRVETIDVYTDTDWAGCPRTRKSTSGGCILLGSHALKSWSSTQSSIALSSGEAEFNGVVRGSGIGLGFQSLLKDVGIEAPVRIWTDSSAAIGICSRQGLGKLRHLDTHTLWVQQAVRSRRIDLKKIDGEVNPADLFTKHSLGRERLGALIQLFDCEFRGGRAESAPKMRTNTSTRTTMAEAHAVDERQGENAPVMPHKVFSKEELDALYPSIEVPDEDDGEEEEKEDQLLKAGEEIAEEICEKALRFGRRRLQKIKMR